MFSTRKEAGPNSVKGEYPKDKEETLGGDGQSFR